MLFVVRAKKLNKAFLQNTNTIKMDFFFHHSKNVAQSWTWLNGCLPMIPWKTVFLLISYPYFSNFGQYITDESCSRMHISCVSWFCYCW